MKTRKRRFSGLFILLLLVVVACKKDDANNNSNTPGPGTPDNRDQFVGTYAVLDTMIRPDPFWEVHRSYLMVVTKDASNPSRINLYNLTNDNRTYFAITSGNMFNLPEQGSSDIWTDITIFGTGTLNGNVMRFFLESGGADDYYTVSGTGTK